MATTSTEQSPQSTWTATLLPSGLFLLYVDEAQPGAAMALAATASRSVGRVIAGSVNENTMVSEAGVFEQGDEVWWISHDWSIDSDHLEVRGRAPSMVGESMRAATESSSKGVDEVFEVPVQVFESLTGFRYGSCALEPFVVLRGLACRMVLAVPLASKNDVLDGLGLRELDARSDYMVQPWWSTETRRGLWILNSTKGDRRILAEGTRLVEKGVTCCLCVANESNLFSYFKLEHESSRFSFELRHVGLDGADDLTARGNVPGRVREWIRKARADTAREPQVHYLWQVPVDAFEAETGHAMMHLRSAEVILEPP